MLTHGELFAGISGFGLGFDRAGLKTVWHVENDKHCQTVLRKHYPDNLILSDIKDVGSRNLPQVNVISFGSPCQGLSVAGKGEGLKDDRSILFFEAIRVVAELNPDFAIWENVPGALSSNSGRDFATVLSEFRRIGAIDLAWRTFDAQYFSLAQRRRRVFLVADFRGECAAEILFESQSMPGNPPPRRQTKQESAQNAQTGIGVGGSGEAGFCLKVGTADSGGDGIINTTLVFIPELARPLAHGKTQDHWDESQETYIAFGSGNQNEIDIATCCSAHGGRDDFESETFILDARNGSVDKEIAHTLQSKQNGYSLNTEPIVFDWQSGGDVRHNVSREVTSTLQANQTPAIRRLTPLEKERLQGFPDGYTAMCSDTARGRMLGNAVAVPVAKWIGKRIMKVTNK
jgi:DNA (cytosine-5)-methyltransferase 1